MPSPKPFTGTLFKTGRTKIRKDRVRTRLDRVNAENLNKGKVRRRDRGCRFPLCGCRRFKVPLCTEPEVSHNRHKGMGGNPAGDRSLPEEMLQLCKHRHQDGRISRHAGTMRARPLRARDGFNGPAEFQIDTSALDGTRGRTGSQHWRTVATELRPGVLGPLTDWQRETLELLAEMDL